LKLEQFYTGVTCEDAGIDNSDIKYFCHKVGRLIIKSFNVKEWIEADVNGSFNEKYTEFTKSKKKSSINLGDMIGKGGGNFRRKRLP